MTELDAMREFFRRHLGDDWELRLILADAIADRNASIRDAPMAQRRAVDLVSETCQDWTVELRDLAAPAWQTLWLR